MRFARAARCTLIGSAVAAVAALDWTFIVMRGVLTQQPDGPIFMILVVYSTAPTRVLAVFLGFVIAAAACRWGSRVPGTPGAKTMFTIVATASVVLAVRSLDLSWQFQANGAMQLWLLGVTALLITATASAVAMEASAVKEAAMAAGCCEVDAASSGNAETGV